MIRKGVSEEAPFDHTNLEGRLRLDLAAAGSQELTESCFEFHASGRMIVTTASTTADSFEFVKSPAIRCMSDEFAEKSLPGLA